MRRSQQSSDTSSSTSSPEVTKKTNKKTKKSNNKPKCKIILNISDCQYPVVPKVGKKLQWKIQKNPEVMDWDVFWTDNAVQPEILFKMEPHQKINHFPGMFNLARKNLMGRYLMKMRKKFPDQYNFFPLTWMLPVEYHDLKNYFESRQKGKARTFIVKPEAMSQGKGIFLTRKLEDIEPGSHCVVQRYLHKPYLIEGLKFDLRIYVLVAGVDPLRLYIFDEGLTRLATEKYQPPTRQNMQDTCMHLTNYAINKDNPKFIFNNTQKDMTKGHKRSLKWFYQYLEANDPKSTNLKQKIEEMIVKTMISGLPPIANQYRSCQPQNHAANMCFELLGFDVMLTEKCQPVLLQINHTPSFSTDTPLDNLIKTNFIKDSLVLMNINEKTKHQIIKTRKQICQQRVITGKKVKVSPEEREVLRKDAQEERDRFESKHLGGFKKIYPIDDEEKMEKYQEFLTHSNQLYSLSTGIKNRRTITKTDKIESAFGTCISRKNKGASILNSSQNRRSPKKDTRENTKKSENQISNLKIQLEKCPAYSQKNISKKHEMDTKNVPIPALVQNQSQMGEQEHFDQNYMNKCSKSENNLFQKLDEKIIKLKQQCSEGLQQPGQDFIKESNVCQDECEEHYDQFNADYQPNNYFFKRKNQAKQDNASIENLNPASLYANRQKNSQRSIQQSSKSNNINICFAKQRQYVNPKNLGIYFQPTNDQNLSRNTFSSKDQRKNQINQKRAGSIGIMGQTNCNKSEMGSNIISSVRKAAKNYTFTANPNIPLSQVQKQKTTNIERAVCNPSKIPITLNTLLINGLDMKNSDVSAQNIKKILTMGYGNYNSNTISNLTGGRNGQAK